MSTASEELAMSTASTSVPAQKKKPHLFDLPPPLLVSVFESLLFEDIVCMVEFIISNDKGRSMWHTQIKGMLRCPAMNNHKYSKEALRWVLDKEITIRNFTTQELEEGTTELHHACFEGSAWIAQACFSFNDADINAPDDKGSTPLHYVCIKSDSTVVMDLLLTSGADVNAVDFRGWTPLFEAAFNGRPGCAAALLAAGAEVNRVIGGEDTPYTPLDLTSALIELDESKAIGRAEVVELLEAAGGLTAVELDGSDDDDDDEEDGSDEDDE